MESVGPEYGVIVIEFDLIRTNGKSEEPRKSKPTY